jgi:hypothetical protein
MMRKQVKRLLRVSGAGNEEEVEKLARRLIDLARVKLRTKA